MTTWKKVPWSDEVPYSKITSPTDGQIIAYKAADSAFENFDPNVRILSSGGSGFLVLDSNGKIGVGSLPTITQSTKHDANTYKRYYAKLASSGDIIPAVTSKVIKVHAIAIQALADSVEFDITPGSTGQSLDHYKLNAREGNNLQPFIYPGCWLQTSAGSSLYCKFSSAASTKFTVVYTDSDAS